MQSDIFQSKDYQELISSHLANSIEFLFENNQEFAIACEVEYLRFEPELPKDISDGFGATVLFMLTGYTYESAKLDKQYFSFEAGFGEENFGALVTLPLLSIKQIFVGEYPIAINVSRPPEREEESDIEAIDSTRSMEALLSNPENKRLLKKKRH
ncbi:FIG00469468: hypothetical protein [hydrothermal vent metagenome]|uniref:Stringent starvation protein B n=1 Tax=hydrothermal vent metagenome TaxID=652676 RepID=A0A1W1B9B7_9ZZZZ